MRISDWSSDVCSSDLLDLPNGPRGRKALRTHVGAVHDGVAAIETERVFQFVKPFARHFVAAVGQPAIGLKENGRTKKLVRIPPIARSEEHSSELQSLMRIPYAAFCLK